jgi:DNA recombination protein RmuC
VFAQSDLLILGLLVTVIVFLAAVTVFLILILNRLPKDFWVKTAFNFETLQQQQAQIENRLQTELAQNRVETTANAQQAREELRHWQTDFNGLLLKQNAIQKNALDAFAKQQQRLARYTEDKLEAMRKTMASEIKALKQDNSQRLEQMRATVDEKLHATLEKRLGHSFQQVSDRLEQVYKGLGEMRRLATGVGDLKKVLTNVKTRGIWGEVQLGQILEQILSPGQYATEVATKPGSNARVEFALKLPGPDPAGGEVVWLPIDAKFPQEDYQRLLVAQEAADRDLAAKWTKSLTTRIKAEAQNIATKYLDPPHTTDFGIMFLPVEGLYAEVLRQPGLCEDLQRNHRIVVAGPTTLAALLNSLQMGFRTLAIEKRSSEVWVLLGAIKTEFGKFGTVLTKTKQKLTEASQTIDQAETRTRAIQRKLRKVQQLPPA